MGKPSISAALKTIKPTSNVATTNPPKAQKVSNIKNKFVNPEGFAIQENNSLVWVEMKAIPVYKLSNNVRALNVIAKDGNSASGLIVDLKTRQYMFKFLSTTEIMEQLSHTWEPYENWASTAAQAAASLEIELPENLGALSAAMGGGILSALSKTFQSFKDAGGGDFAGLQSQVSALATSGFGANYRVDVPLQYKGSERRSFDLTFNLINTTPKKNHDNVVLPVKLLEMFSSPSYGKEPSGFANADIILPYLFEIKTTPGNLISVDLAVLKSVQPTWRGPWIKGYPSRCELRLSFTEYRPLEQTVFYGSTDSRITSVQNERKNAVYKMEEEEEKQKKEAEENAQEKKDDKTFTETLENYGKIGGFSFS